MAEWSRILRWLEKLNRWKHNSEISLFEALITKDPFKTRSKSRVVVTATASLKRGEEPPASNSRRKFQRSRELWCDDVGFRHTHNMTRNTVKMVRQLPEGHTCWLMDMVQAVIAVGQGSVINRPAVPTIDETALLCFQDSRGWGEIERIFSARTLSGEVI